eukprot:7676211-Alexandrium_andersonii.AAC.1
MVSSNRFLSVSREPSKGSVIEGDRSAVTPSILLTPSISCVPGRQAFLSARRNASSSSARAP